MNILVPIKFVPDPVEDLEIDAGTGLLDRTFLRLMPSELDDHALEEALLLTERHGGGVTVVTLDWGDVDETLFTAIAKGAKRAIKIRGDGFEQGLGNQRIAAILEPVIKDIAFDLILVGTQALDDLDGFAGALLAERLGLPYVGYVTKVEVDGNKVVASKEYPGGLAGEIEVTGPAVLGIQAAEKAPRYVVTSKIMEAMKSAKIEEIDASEAPSELDVLVEEMSAPQSAAHAEMIEGGVPQVADRLVALLRERGVVA
jgi:electron transfer flavoprotein beta subunit